MLNPTTPALRVCCPTLAALALLRGSVTVAEPRAVAPGFRPSGGLARRGFRVRNFTYDEGRSCDAVLALAAARALPIVTKRGVPPARRYPSAPVESFAPRVVLQDHAGFSIKKVTLQNTNPVAGTASSDVAAPVSPVSPVPTVPGVAFTDLGLSET